MLSYVIIWRKENLLAAGPDAQHSICRLMRLFLDPRGQVNAVIAQSIDEAFHDEPLARFVDNLHAVYEGHQSSPSF